MIYVLNMVKIDIITNIFIEIIFFLDINDFINFIQI